MKGKIVFLWIFSFIFTVAIAYYQRKTGPTYPVMGKAEIAGQKVKYRLIRTNDSGKDAKVKVKNVNEGINGQIRYKRLGTNDEWITIAMLRDGQMLSGDLPSQPPAGKLMYQVTLISGNEQVLLNDEPAVIRFKGSVPVWVLIPHIIFMFTAMMMSTRTGLEAVAKGKKTLYFARVTMVTLFIGGLILGPIVQKYAFGAFWTGWPFGKDLTDDKTLFAFIFWALAVWRLYRNRENRIWPIIAMSILLMVYLIPHSMFGSELDYSSGAVVTGK